jgi:hypothetical protein
MVLCIIRPVPAMKLIAEAAVLSNLISQTFSRRQSMQVSLSHSFESSTVNAGDINIGHLLDTRKDVGRNSLKMLALPRGLEPLFPP